MVGLIWPSPLVKCLRKHLGWLNQLLIGWSGWSCISKGNTSGPFRRFVDHMDISFLPFVADCLVHLLFYHRIQSHKIDNFLTSNTLINPFPNRNQACKVNDLGTNHLLVVRGLRLSMNHLIISSSIMGGSTCAGSSRTFGHTHGKIPHSSFLSFKELCSWELSQYWTGNNLRMHWPSLSS